VSTDDAARPARTVDRALAAVLALLDHLRPDPMNLSLPVLPALTRELGAATAVAQLVAATSGQR
jgi:DHA1 family bicyclomycin/chloramphenicol resistance-like MFS transporter